MRDFNDGIESADRCNLRWARRRALRRREPSTCGVPSPAASRAPPLCTNIDDTNLWASSYRSDDLLQYDNDMSSGQSGAAVYVKLSSNDRRIVAVNAHSVVSTGIARGPRFRASMWNDVCEWIANVPSQFGVHNTCH